MLKAAKPGSTIDLGNRPVTFERYRGLANVTIKGGIFGAITLDQWQNVTFSGTRFTPGATDDPRGPLVLTYQPDGLHFINTTWVGRNTPDGQLAYASISARGGNNVTVRKSTFTNMANFMAFLRTTNVEVSDSVFQNVREGVQLVGGTTALITRNHFGPYRPAPGDHADAVQLFTAGLTLADDHGARDVLIEDNFIDPGPDFHTQGVFMRDEAGLYNFGRGYSNITVRNNLLIGTGWHGISAQDPVQNLLIDSNKLLIRINGDGVTDNWIMVKAGGGIVRNNYAGSFLLSASVTSSGNTVVARAATVSEISSAIAAYTQRVQAAAAKQ
ncbi:right-handed parallel beta-helix repeat-containing protein [uncultured Sphingomonas sp.]|uniref:right-handed parallel beta-helix repeat-containing protein n=1 Tax=uncultured Sphingomonas sp. TaxID=158754 RepID=UPI00260F29DC|nr:right-handed parallel beta-helix repeat-containing protein [uncultured Sphingomonas sp.]